MDTLQELRLHVEALAAAVEANGAFFVSVIHYVRRLKQLVEGSGGAVPRSELQVLAGKLEEFWAQWRPSGDGLYIPPRETSDTDSTVRQINLLVGRVAALDEKSFLELVEKASFGIPSPHRGPPSTRPCVFIGHGRSRLWARVKTYLEDELSLATVTYESEPRTGESITPVLEKMLDQATFAVLILTAEDETSDGAKRARQNVIHEAGLFQGRLGFRRAVLLVQEGVEPFTNIAGLQHIPFAGQNIEQSFYELRRVLKREQQCGP